MDVEQLQVRIAIGVRNNGCPRATSGRSGALSKPGLPDYRRGQLVRSVRNRLDAEGMAVKVLERSEYADGFGSLAEVKRRISECAGAVLLGFRDIAIKDGLWREGTSEQASLEGCYHSTAWMHIEAGMAIMAGLPVVLVSESQIRGGVFDLSDGEHVLYRADPDDLEGSTAFADWCMAVRAVAQRLH